MKSTNSSFSQLGLKIRLMLAHKGIIALLVSLFAGLVFFVLSTVRLGAQGLYYDEVFQATSSFAYQGQPVHQFTVLQIRGLPIMNLPYVGAIKTALYGLFLKFSGQAFGVISWRLVGIISVSLGVFFFGVIVRKRLPMIGLVAFLFLLITDLTVMLTTRFDWGPVALALFFRLLLIAIWINGELSTDLRPGNSFWMGFLLGISIFEKFTAIVLFVPLVLMIFLSPRRRNMRHLGALAVGGVIGLSPLILANLYSFYRKGYFISLQLQGALLQKSHSFLYFLGIVKEYLSLGAGDRVQTFILGVSRPALSLSETALFALMLVLMIIILVSKTLRGSIYFRLSAVMLLCYFTIILGIYFLPTPTWIHHWVIATPFQYAAIALFALGVINPISIKPANLYKVLFAILFGFLVLSRLFGVSFLEQSFVNGNASLHWDPSLSTMGEFAASQSDRAIFIAADWGVANQMICFSNGKPGVVYERYAEDQDSLDQVLNMIRDSDKSDVYLVFPREIYFAPPQLRSLLLREINSQLGHEWADQFIGSELDRLKSVVVYKFSRLSP